MITGHFIFKVDDTGKPIATEEEKQRVYKVHGGTSVPCVRKGDYVYIPTYKH